MGDAPGDQTRRAAQEKRLLDVDVNALSGRDRYRLLTSLVVPRPIAWVSTWNAAGTPNLAPFSYYAALSGTPALVGISIGSRAGRPKDTLANIRESGSLCVNVVTEAQLEAMNLTSAEVAPDVDEFELAGLLSAPSDVVEAPHVSGCPAVLECELRSEVPLPGSSNVLVIAEVVGIKVDRALLEGPLGPVDPARLRPIGRLGGEGYMLPSSFAFYTRP